MSKGKYTLQETINKTPDGYLNILMIKFYNLLSWDFTSKIHCPETLDDIMNYFSLLIIIYQISLDATVLRTLSLLIKQITLCYTVVKFEFIIIFLINILIYQLFGWVIKKFSKMMRNVFEIIINILLNHPVLHDGY